MFTGNELGWQWWLALIGIGYGIVQLVKEKIGFSSASTRAKEFEVRLTKAITAIQANELQSRRRVTITAIPPSPPRQSAAQYRCMQKINSQLIGAGDKPISAMETHRLTLVVQEVLAMALHDEEKIDRLFQHEYRRSHRRPCEVLEVVIERWRRDLEVSG
jgi:hypothetical protein